MSKVETNTHIVSKVLGNKNLIQQGVPDPTKVGIERTFRYMTDPNNRNIYNTFVQGLFEFVGTQIVRSREFINPLAQFKRYDVRSGQAIQEIGLQLVKARAYDQFDIEGFLREHPPVIDAAYHHVDRKEKYEISVNNQLLINSFLTEGGLSSFVSSVLQQPINSDNFDEFNLMVGLIGKYEQHHGFRKVKVPELTGTNQGEIEFATKQFIKAVRSIAGQWAITYSTDYNAYHIPTFTPKGATYLITTPEVMATVDVNVLASAFNVSAAELEQRIVLVNEIPVDKCYALMVDEDWFVCGDQLYENRTFENPSTLTTNFFLHHWSMLSTSPMLNCVAFVTGDATPKKETTFTYGDELTMELHDESGATITNIDLDGKNYLKGSVSVDSSDDSLDGKAEDVDFTIDSIKTSASDDTTVPLNSRTYVDNYGLMHFQSAVKSGMVVKVTGTSVTKPTVKATKEFTVK